MKKILLEQFENKTVNFYLDKNEVSRAGDAVIKYVDGKGEDIVLVVELLNDIRMGKISHRKGEKFGLKYSCSHTKMTPLKGGFYVDKYMPLGKTTFQDYWEDTGFLYNSQLANELAKKFCAVSKGGTPVPKRDYSMTDQEPEQSMAEEKRVVRLTEKDLTRIIKRVLSEDDSLSGDNIESCIRQKMAYYGLPQLNLKSEELRQIMIACRPGSNDGDMMVGCFTKGIEIGSKYGANEAQKIMKVAPMIPKLMSECAKKSNLPST